MSNNSQEIANTPRNTRLMALIHLTNQMIVQAAGIRALAFDCDEVTGRMCDALARVCVDLNGQLQLETTREGNDGAKVQRATPEETIRIVKS